ncbi:MAG TPA: hypothetical protein VIL73_12175 [Gaiellaceae bacterium]
MARLTTSARRRLDTPWTRDDATRPAPYKPDTAVQVALWLRIVLIVIAAVIVLIAFLH